MDEETIFNMINLKVRTEYSFRKAYGRLPDIISTTKGNAIGIADFGTWGWVKFKKECEKQNKKPIFGIEFAVCLNADEKTKQPTSYMTMIAKNKSGVKTIYELATYSNNYFYYEPRLDYEKLLDFCNDDVILLSGSNPQMAFFKDYNNFYLEASPRDPSWLRKINDVSKKYNKPIVACSDNQYPRPEHKGVYEIVVGDRNRYSRTTIQHIATEWELKVAMPMIPESAYTITNDIADSIETFDLPARGSSAGSLVCYLLDITDVDPIKHGLMFERFVDVNRLDLPDIDIDFPDSKRESVIEDLRNKYGADCVAHIGTVSRLKPKSALTEVSKSLKIPLWEVEDLKKSIVERSSGDARASFCIRDTFETLDIGKDMVKKYPGLRAAEEMKKHLKYLMMKSLLAYFSLRVTHYKVFVNR
jgi:DNA polymerase III alpha subunit